MEGFEFNCPTVALKSCLVLLQLLQHISTANVGLDIVASQRYRLLVIGDRLVESPKSAQ